MSLKNGRSSYNELRKTYDRTIIRHEQQDDGTARTTCVLVSGNSVFVGVARFTNRTFNFSKKKGRAIAQGRAEHAVNVFNNETTRRQSQNKRREELSYTLSGANAESVQALIEGLIPTNNDSKE